MFNTLQSIGQKFRLEGKFYSFEENQMGNINSTYKVTYRKDDGKYKSYLFQRVNKTVFPNAQAVMKNIDLVTEHMRSKKINEVNLHFHHTPEGLNYYLDANGDFWRVMNYIDSVTFNTSDDPMVVYYTGVAFGRFQIQLDDFDGSQLTETIPDFHNTKKRLDKLFADVDSADKERLAEVKDELDYIASVKDLAAELSIRYKDGEFPIRVTHNDTKSNNVLFDKFTKQPLAVIDLDTVMPGMLMYDFGDAVRFICNTSAEDEPETRRVFFDTYKFRAFARGFLHEVKDILTPEEKGALVLAAFSVTVELASRFLDDYIMGDKYFKTNYPSHNLVRTRCQIKLAKDIYAKAEELQWVIDDVIENY